VENPSLLAKLARTATLLLAVSLRLPAAQTSSATTLFPAAGAAHVCPDTPLKLTFASVPVLGAAGKIQVFDAGTRAVVETIDVSSPTATKTIGGFPDFKYYPVIVSGREAAIYLKNSALAYDKTYYVTIDPGVFKTDAGNDPGITDAAAWRFTTRHMPPAAGRDVINVAADGTGDFCTVQGALDFVPEGNTTPVTILVHRGTYNEIIAFTDKHAITLLGEDRRQTVIAYANNANFNASGGNPFAGNAPNPSAATKQGGSIYHRGMFLAQHVNDLTIANLTMRNTTKQGGSQAETIILNGTTEARAIIKDVDFYSFQDTIQINGQAFVSNCYIEGDVDFMWGTGPCFFENCTAHTVRTGAYYTQIRNPGTNHGFVYRLCTFDGAPGVTDNYLSRIAPGRFPASEVVLLDCTLGSSVIPAGWLLEKNPNAPNDPVTPAGVHFWEFNSHTADGRPIDASHRLPGSVQLKQPDDAAMIRNYSDPTFVLGHDWNPRAASIFR